MGFGQPAPMPGMGSPVMNDRFASSPPQQPRQGKDASAARPVPGRASTLRTGTAEEEHPAETRPRPSQVRVSIGGPCHPTVIVDGSGGPTPVAGSPKRFRRFGSSWRLKFARR